MRCGAVHWGRRSASVVWLQVRKHWGRQRRDAAVCVCEGRGLSSDTAVGPGNHATEDAIGLESVGVLAKRARVEALQRDAVVGW